MHYTGMGIWTTNNIYKIYTFLDSRPSSRHVSLQHGDPPQPGDQDCDQDAGVHQLVQHDRGVHLHWGHGPYRLRGQPAR